MGDMQEVTKLLGLWREQTDVLGTCFVVRLDQAADELDAASEADAKVAKAPGQLGMSARARDLLEAASGLRDGCLVGLTRDALVEAWKDGRAAGQAMPAEQVVQLQREAEGNKGRIAELESLVELQGSGRGPGELTSANDLRKLGCEGPDAATVMRSAVVLLQRRGEEVAALVAAGDTLRGQRTRLRERLAAGLAVHEDETKRKCAELEGEARNLRGRCATMATQASERESATLAAEDLHRQQVVGANRRGARLRSQSEAWRERAETRESEVLELRARAESAEALAAGMSDALTAPSLREVDPSAVSKAAQSEVRRMTEGATPADSSDAVYVGRDVLEAAHELRLLGCDGECALEVMVDAARVLSESATANVRLQVKVQRMGGALDRVRHTIAQELEAHELAMTESQVG